MMCVSSVDMLNTYYDLFKQKKEAGEHDLRVVTIFTYNPNEADVEATGETGDPDFESSYVRKHRTLRQAQGATSERRAELVEVQSGSPESVEGDENKAKQSREKLEACVEDYNAMYQTPANGKGQQGLLYLLQRHRQAHERAR